MNPAEAVQTQQTEGSGPKKHNETITGAGHPDGVAPSAQSNEKGMARGASEPTPHPSAPLLPTNPQVYEPERKVIVEGIPMPQAAACPITAPHHRGSPAPRRSPDHMSDAKRNSRRSRSRSRERDRETRERSRDDSRGHRHENHSSLDHRRARSRSPPRGHHHDRKDDRHDRQNFQTELRSPRPRYNHEELNRKRTRSRSRSEERRHAHARSTSPDHRQHHAAYAGHPTVLPSPPLSLSPSPSKKIFHESTLVSLRTSTGPVSFPLMPSDLEEEELPPPSPGHDVHHRTLDPMIFGSARAQGLRPYMEDRHVIVENLAPVSSDGVPILDDVPRCFAAIYDGHNGCLAADHAAERLHHILVADPALQACIGKGPPAAILQEEEHMGAALINAFETTDKEILSRCKLENLRGGATGVVVVRCGDILYAAHCGDSRAVLCRRGEPLRLTEDHKPNLPRERKRVEALGGRVDFARCWRVIVNPGDGRNASGLAVSRAFGDPDFKDPLHLVIATPDVMSERLTPEDAFIILASDGLWDVMGDKEACDMVAMQLRAFSTATPKECRIAATLAAEALLKASLDAGTLDNVTVVVGLLRWT